ncbi:LURP-one-related/scramblase family protein [Vagococcus intermedius]|uniref:YxjI n=1 Tax=Vagococcus intermedius TaxID=2991418 RepID=A0AAF0I602_9ENTE|nr:hypothetical protein [Vagococcus intermedius]WEG73288.1 hypothetical protein OL234_10190 [Vagococcus intermedius]WEG75369.1 hypothetical protein OL235_10185 [Vagococcus intermedius]
MTSYYIRKTRLSSNYRTIVKDEHGQPCYLLVGNWGRRGDVFSLFKMDGQRIASIKQASWAFTLGSRFDLYNATDKVGSLKRILSFNRDFYYVHQLGWIVIGDIGNQTYKIQHLNHMIMNLTKINDDTGEFFKLEVEEKHAPLCICIAAVLDYWLRRQNPKVTLFKQPAKELRLD